RVGLFKLSFVLPETLEVESLSGPALSQWTEVREHGARIITLHLSGRTLGDQTFAAVLAVPPRHRRPLGPSHGCWCEKRRDRRANSCSCRKRGYACAVWIATTRHSLIPVLPAAGSRARSPSGSCRPIGRWESESKRSSRGSPCRRSMT